MPGANGREGWLGQEVTEYSWGVWRHLDSGLWNWVDGDGRTLQDRRMARIFLSGRGQRERGSLVHVLAGWGPSSAGWQAGQARQGECRLAGSWQLAPGSAGVGVDITVAAVCSFLVWAPKAGVGAAEGGRRGSCSRPETPLMQYRSRSRRRLHLAHECARTRAVAQHRGQVGAEPPAVPSG